MVSYLAVDRVSKVLLGHPNQAASDEDGHGDSVVQLEHHIVDGQVVSLEDPLCWTKQVQGHFHLGQLKAACHVFFKIFILTLHFYLKPRSDQNYYHDDV